MGEPELTIGGRVWEAWGMSGTPGGEGGGGAEGDQGRPRREGRSLKEGEMAGRRVLGIGLDPYTIDFDSEFFHGKRLNVDIIASGIKAEEQRIRGMGHD